MKTVLVFGTYDILHPGHEFFLKCAREKGDRLVVVVALDETVEKVKGRLPHNSQETRLEGLNRLQWVDEAVLGHAGDKYKVVEEVAPDVICLGYDQQAFTDHLADKLAERNLHPEIVRLESFKPEVYKSSKLRP